MRKALLVLSLLLVPSVLIAQNTQTRFFPAYDHEEVTIDGTARSFTSSKVTSTTNPINSAELASFTVTCSSGTTCPISFLYDSGTPTSSVGQVVDNGTAVYIYGHVNIVNFKAIRTTSTSAVIHVIYHR